MTDKETLQRIRDIISVENTAALIQLQQAAKRVCDTRYSDAEWDELNHAIGELIGVLQKQGIKFDNPRIR